MGANLATYYILPHSPPRWRCESTFLGWRRNQRHQRSTPKGSEVRTVIRHVTKRRETDERCLERDALLRVVLLAKKHMRPRWFATVTLKRRATRMMI